MLATPESSRPPPPVSRDPVNAKSTGTGTAARVPKFTNPPTPTLPMAPPATEPDAFRDWANLPELPLAEVLRGLLPCLRSLYAFAATCRPWRLLLRASAASLVRPRVPPLQLLCPALRLVPFSPLVARQSIPYHLPVSAEGSTFLSASRGYLILLSRGSSNSLLHVVDALAGTKHRAFQLPSPHFPYHHAALSPSHILLFHSRHAFFSLPLPDHPSPNSSRPEWIKHTLPRAASFVTTVLEFSGRVLGLTDRAQILEFHLDRAPQNQTVRMLPTTGLPAATTFESLHFRPHLVAAGKRLLLVLFMLQPKLGYMSPMHKVNKIGVYMLDFVQMMWEEVDNIGPYTLFVDCAGRSAVACLDVENCGVEENRVYVAVPNCRTWMKAIPPGWEVSLDGGASGRFRPPLPSPISVYPPLFF
uniref:Uncharacterized protein n=1 Tax=Avena sativa TaxID=4498 RepID=A0ACD5ZM39_AVESA